MISHPLMRRPAVQGILIIVGFLMLIAVAACDTITNSSSTAPMTATVRIKAGAIYVINEDTFPWYGLIITLGDRWTTEHRFGDWNWPWLSQDSILLPNEDIKPSINAFVDDDGNEYESKLYTIIATKVTLRAKTRVDGTYDLEATFVFSKHDPIIDNSIGRTNRPVEPDNAKHATPYVLTESTERRPTLHVYMNSPYRSEYVEHHELYYEEVEAYVSGYPQNAFGSYELPPFAYEEMVTRFNLDSSFTISSQDQIALDHWNEQWMHWKNVDAFNESIGNVSTDRVINEEESKRICFVSDQWVAQMNAAWDYVEEYREADPETVDKNAGLANLQRKSERALRLLEQAKCD